MSFLAFVDADHVGRFCLDFVRFCRVRPIVPGPRSGPERRRLVGIVVTRGLWGFDAIAPIEDALGATSSMSPSGVWTVIACAEGTAAEDVLAALASSPDARRVSAFVPVFPTADDPDAWRPAWLRLRQRSRGRVLAPLLQAPDGGLVPIETNERRAPSTDAPTEGGLS